MMSTLGPVFAAALWAALGLALGHVHFRGLARTTQAYVGSGVQARTVLLHTIRILITAGALFLVARQGAAPLLAASAGFLVARAAAVRAARRQAR